MTKIEIAKELVEITKELDPYEFADNYSSEEEAITDMLELLESKSWKIIVDGYLSQFVDGNQKQEYLNRLGI